MRKAITLIVCLLLVLTMFLAMTLQALARPEIAKQTGKKCVECHAKADNGNGGGGPHELGPGGNRNK